MSTTLEEVTKQAMDLLPHQRLALAGFLLENVKVGEDPEATAVWDSEIRERIQAIDDGSVTDIPYEEVMRAAEERLAP